MLQNEKKEMKGRKYFRLAALVFWLQLCVTLAASQTAAGSPASGVLRGQVTDPSGAAIANANVVLVPAGASSTPIKTQADGQGQYVFNRLATGQYTLQVIAKAFAVFQNTNILMT